MSSKRKSGIVDGPDSFLSFAQLLSEVRYIHAKLEATIWRGGSVHYFQDPIPCRAEKSHNKAISLFNLFCGYKTYNWAELGKRTCNFS